MYKITKTNSITECGNINHSIALNESNDNREIRIQKKLKNHFHKFSLHIYIHVSLIYTHSRLKAT